MNKEKRKELYKKICSEPDILEKMNIEDLEELVDLMLKEEK